MTTGLTPPQKKVQPVIINRLTVVENIVHQANGGNPVPVGGKPWEKQLLTNEEVYTTRRAMATIDPKPLDLGWLAGQPISMLMFRNDEDGRIPDQTKTLRLAINDIPVLQIPPGESARFNPVAVNEWKISSDQPTRFTLFVVPG